MLEQPDPLLRFPQLRLLAGPDRTPSSRSAWVNQFCRHDSEIPKSAAMSYGDQQLRRTTLNGCPLPHDKAAGPDKASQRVGCKQPFAEAA